MKTFIATLLLTFALSGVANAATIPARNQGYGLSCDEARWAMKIVYGYGATASCWRLNDNNIQTITPTWAHDIRKYCGGTLFSKWCFGKWYISTSRWLYD